jgi:hypothetical protein
MGVSPSTFRRVASTQNLNPITGIANGDDFVGIVDWL